MHPITFKRRPPLILMHLNNQLMLNLKLCFHNFDVPCYSSCCLRQSSPEDLRSHAWCINSTLAWLNIWLLFSSRGLAHGEINSKMLCGHVFLIWTPVAVSAAAAHWNTTTRPASRSPNPMTHLHRSSMKGWLCSAAPVLKRQHYPHSLPT